MLLSFVPCKGPNCRAGNYNVISVLQEAKTILRSRKLLSYVGRLIVLEMKLLYQLI